MKVQASFTAPHALPSSTPTGKVLLDSAINELQK